MTNDNFWNILGEDEHLSSGAFEYSLAADPASNGGAYADVKLLSDSEHNGVMEVHFSMLRGSPGFYSTAMMTHRKPIYLLTGVWGVGVLTGAVNVFAVLLLAGVFVLYLRAYAWIGLLASVTATRTIGAVMIAVPAACLLRYLWS